MQAAFAFRGGESRRSLLGVQEFAVTSRGQDGAGVGGNGRQAKPFYALTVRDDQASRRFLELRHRPGSVPAHRRRYARGLEVLRVVEHALVRSPKAEGGPLAARSCAGLERTRRCVPQLGIGVNARAQPVQEACRREVENVLGRDSGDIWSVAGA